MDKDKHTEHCCIRHGCKYNDPKCSVTTGEKTQSFICEDCAREDIRSVGMLQLIVLGKPRKHKCPHCGSEL